MARARLAATPLHALVQPGTHQGRADLPRGNHGAALRKRRRARQGICRLHGTDVCRRTQLLHLYERQRRQPGLLLPPAQRNPGQRLQLHPGRGGREHRVEVGAHGEPEPLRAAGHTRGTFLRGIPRRGGRPHAQGAAGVQREPEGDAGQGDAAAVRRGLREHQAAVPHHRRERYGGGRREPGHHHQRQPGV